MNSMRLLKDLIKNNLSFVLHLSSLYMYVYVSEYLIKVLLQNILIKMTNFLKIILLKSLFYIILLTNFK